MSDDKQPKVSRAAAPPRMPPEPVTPPRPAAPEPQVAAMPGPEARVALPARVAAPPPGADRRFAAYTETLASIGESQAAVASDLTQIALEVSGLTRANLMAVGDGVTAVLTARSPIDAVQAQLGLVRRSLDAFADGSTRLGGLGLRLASDAAKPIFRPFPAV